MSMPSFDLPLPLPNVEITRPRAGQRMRPMPVAVGAVSPFSTARSMTFSALVGGV
jgi:hypothetical protein